jgi:hypothetical protein
MIDTGTQYAGLSDVERAAAMVDPHMPTCDAPTIGECRYCRTRLATIRELVSAVTPVIERYARRQVAVEIDRYARDRERNGASDAAVRALKDAVAIARSELRSAAHLTVEENNRG